MTIMQKQSKLSATRHYWTQEEVGKLCHYVKIYGAKEWQKVADYVGSGRNASSCRDRWKSFHRQDLKEGDFTDEEKIKIQRLHSEFGNKWSKIADHLPGRPSNKIKNFWNKKEAAKKRLMRRRIEPARRSLSFSSTPAADSDCSVVLPPPPEWPHQTQASDYSGVAIGGAQASVYPANLYNIQQLGQFRPTLVGPLPMIQEPQKPFSTDEMEQMQWGIIGPPVQSPAPAAALVLPPPPEWPHQTQASDYSGVTIGGAQASVYPANLYNIQQLGQFTWPTLVGLLPMIQEPQQPFSTDEMEQMQGGVGPVQSPAPAVALVLLPLPEWPHQTQASDYSGDAIGGAQASVCPSDLYNIQQLRQFTWPTLVGPLPMIQEPQKPFSTDDMEQMQWDIGPVQSPAPALGFNPNYHLELAAALQNPNGAYIP